MTNPKTPEDVLREALVELQSVLNGIRSDGPVMDTLSAEGPWWTPPDPTGVRLYDAIIAASHAVGLAHDRPSGSMGLDVERLARALHEVGHVLDGEGSCNNVEGDDCLGRDWHRRDATDIAAIYGESQLLDPARLARAIRKSMDEPGYGYIDIDRYAPDADIRAEAERIAVEYARLTEAKPETPA